MARRLRPQRDAASKHPRIRNDEIGTYLPDARGEMVDSFCLMAGVSVDGVRGHGYAEAAEHKKQEENPARGQDDRIGSRPSRRTLEGHRLSLI
jgi:hypothetical protein